MLTSGGADGHPALHCTHTARTQKHIHTETHSHTATCAHSLAGREVSMAIPCIIACRASRAHIRTHTVHTAHPSCECWTHLRAGRCRWPFCASWRAAQGASWRSWGGWAGLHMHSHAVLRVQCACTRACVRARPLLLGEVGARARACVCKRGEGTVSGKQQWSQAQRVP